MEHVDNQTAFITGGASGIGLGMAQAFLGAGMRVVIADVRREALDSARKALNADARVHTVQLDVSDREAWRVAADDAYRRFGNVHVLCNNAGVGMLGGIPSMTYDDWDWCFSVNLGGAVNGIQTFLPHMTAHGESAHIVNTSSIGVLSPGPGGAAYLSAKAAVLVLSECLKIELAGTKIGVSVLVPGPTQTNINRVGELRPKKYQKTGLREVEDKLALRPLFANGIDPQRVGDIVLDAVRRDLLFVFTHNEFRNGVEERSKAILQAFPRGPVDHERAQQYGFPLVNPVYTNILERDPPPAGQSNF